MDKRDQDELYCLPERTQRELAYEGMLFVTSYKVGGKDFGGILIARNMEHAVQRAADRGLGESVDGRLESFGRLQDLG